MVKKGLVLFLALCMTLSLAACARSSDSEASDAGNSSANSDGSIASQNSVVEEETKAPDYVNLDSALPFVKEDSGEKVTLSMYVAAQDAAKNVDDTWQWVYLQDQGNITLDITLIQWGAKEEKKNLALSSGIIPDIMYNMQLNSADIVNYGSSEHILADLTDLIANYAPDIQATFDQYPDFKLTLTMPDNAIYSLSGLGDDNAVANYAMWVHSDWLSGIGMDKTPSTLDEFTDMLVQFKEKNPMQVEEDKLVPLAGYSGADYPTAFILQALGFQINTFRVERIYDYAVVGDHCSIICCDDLYARYLEVARDWYEKGLISQDYFSIDWKTTRAQAGSGYCGAYAQFGMSTIVSNGFAGDDSFVEKWVACSPLTSEWNDTPVAKSGSGNSIGNFTISEDCSNKEVAIRFANWFFTEEGALLKKYGPAKGSDVDTYGLLDGWYMEKDETSGELKMQQNEQLAIYSGYECLGYIANYKPFPNTGNLLIANQYKVAGYEGEYAKEGDFDLNTITGRVSKQRYDAVAPYAVSGAPDILYFDADTAARVSDLTSVVQTYALSETAKFITGARDISEVEDYLREVRAAGGDELNEIYNKAYQEYLANLN